MSEPTKPPEGTSQPHPPGNVPDLKSQIPRPTSAEGGCILYCHCAYTKIVPEDVKEAVLDKLARSGVAFEAVPDLCEMAASKDPALPRIAATPGVQSVRIAACYERAVRWLFDSADAPLSADAEVFNMRVETAEEVLDGLLDSGTSNLEENS